MSEEIILLSMTVSELERIIMRCVDTVLRNQPKTDPAKPGGYITRLQVCELLHVSMPTIHKWIKEGKLKPYHIGGRTLFRESEVLEGVKPVNYGKKGGR